MGIAMICNAVQGLQTQLNRAPKRTHPRGEGERVLKNKRSSGFPAENKRSTAESRIMDATTLSFRAGADFAEKTRSLASIVGLKSSEYIRQAVSEKNEQVMAQRIATLSKELAAEHLAFNESLEGSLADGIE